jgi:shikimate kinase/3-dehydroquinate synthase
VTARSSEGASAAPPPRALRGPLGFVWGPPGVGKTTLGRLAAERLGVSFVDLDQHLERATGRTVSALFEREGEAGFRARERAALLELIGEASSGARAPTVVALGGGALVDPELRRRALEAGPVISLVASRAALVARLARANDRPLLVGELEERLAALLELRGEAYAECSWQLDADVSLEEGSERLARALADGYALVRLGARSSRVRVAHELEGPLAELARGRSTFVVSDDTVAALHGARVASALGAPLSTFRAGEPSKTLATVERLAASLADAGADREAVLVALGGGVTTDLTGFVAATLYRGVDWVAVPTTVLACVDAALGGKTAVDLGPRKNALGAFHQPRAVLVEPSLLATEPERSYRAGLAELVKTACVGDAALFDELERDVERFVAREPRALAEAMLAAARVKAALVSADERERTGLRVRLNFGHTLGHALEAASGYSLMHGEAVSIGMASMLSIGVELGVTPPALCERVVTLLARLGLPTRAADEGTRARALELVRYDKKRRGDAIEVVLLLALGAPTPRLLDVSELVRLARGAASSDGPAG